MSLRLRLLFACLGILVCSGTGAVRSADRVVAAADEVPISPLRTVSTVRLSQGGYLAWAGPVLCDEDENIYFLILPHSPSRDAQGGSIAAADVSNPRFPNPRDVLRISADGKTRITFNPAASSKFVGAEELTTRAMALDQAGRLFTLIWARWVEKGSEAEKGRQYIVSFDQKGKYRSHFEVDWEEILIQQFEVFGSGEFLLRGIRPHTAETRMAVLSSGGQKLEDVRGRGGYPSKLLDEPSPPGKVEFDHMVRGGDGRIYVTEKDVQQGKDVVHAFGPSGESAEVFKLRQMPKDPQLQAWKAAGDRFAAAYLGAEQQADGSTSGDQKGRWRIAVYGSSGNGVELQSVYGPAPGPPLCYQYKASGNRFTFLKDAATLVTMSSP